ncbi:MAG: universal stress protein [Verrucomicrobia bacterium]|nr:MAG: universal stress protein [Verrucomicrobiota bacterium]
MYQKILVALENSRADESVIPHVTELARKLGSELLLLHVADGFAARHYDNLKLVESQEMKDDRDYLEKIAATMRARGIKVSTQLVCGNPPTEIVKAASADKCDLIAMTSHGHRLIGDIFFGSTIHEVRHRTNIPVLLVRQEKQ